MTALRPLAAGLALLVFSLVSLARAEPAGETGQGDQFRAQGLFSLLNQIDALKSEVARLRGAQEEMAYRLEQADRRHKDVLADFDARLKETHQLASRPVTVEAPAAKPAPAEAAPNPTDAPAPVPAPKTDPEAEARVYEAALALLKANNQAGAVEAFKTFLDKYPDSSLAGNACYWQGLAYYSQGDHNNTIAIQQRLLRDYPLHDKVPDAMVSIARAQIQKGETEAARAGLEQVLAQYPKSRAANLANKILALFK